MVFRMVPQMVFRMVLQMVFRMVLQMVFRIALQKVFRIAFRMVFRIVIWNGQERARHRHAREFGSLGPLWTTTVYTAKARSPLAPPLSPSLQYAMMTKCLFARGLVPASPLGLRRPGGVPARCGAA